MTESEYVKHLETKGYKSLGKSRVALGSLIFDVKETINHAATGAQSTFCLKLSPKSDTNLCPSPWN